MEPSKRVHECTTGVCWLFRLGTCPASYHWGLGVYHVRSSKPPGCDWNVLAPLTLSICCFLLSISGFSSSRYEFVPARTIKNRSACFSLNHVTQWSVEFGKEGDLLSKKICLKIHYFTVPWHWGSTSHLCCVWIQAGILQRDIPKLGQKSSPWPHTTKMDMDSKAQSIFYWQTSVCLFVSNSVGKKKHKHVWN